MRRPEVRGQSVRSLRRDVEPPSNITWLRGIARRSDAEMALLEGLPAG